VRWLQEHGVTIWDEWAREDGDLGPVYGVQWRAWPTPDGGHIDQIAHVVQQLRTQPDSRRIIVSAWNVAALSKMALLPCHAFFQFYVAPAGERGGRGRLSCRLHQRSADIFLGVPFNIASYALLTHMLAQQCDLDVGDFVSTGGDCHIYANHREQVDLQLSRAPYPYPVLHLKKCARRRSSTTPTRISRFSSTSTIRRSRRRRPHDAGPALPRRRLSMTRPVIQLVAAVARNGVIGDGGDLIRRIPEDLAHFRRVTTGCPVVMGRRTWLSMPPRFRPLAAGASA
jgi:hypothetical protein